MIPISEIEAKNKICPFITIVPDGGNCIGSGCIAWRKEEVSWGKVYRERVRVCEISGALKVIDAGPGPSEEGWEFVPYNQSTGELAKWVLKEEEDPTPSDIGYCERLGNK